MLSKPKTRPQYDIKKTSAKFFAVQFPSKGAGPRRRMIKMEDRNTPETARVIKRARNEWLKKDDLKEMTAWGRSQFFKNIGIPESAREKIPEGKFEKGTIVQIPNVPNLFGLTKAKRGENQTLDIDLTVKRTTSIQNVVAQAARYAQELNMPGQSVSLKFESNGKYVSTPFMEPDENNLFEALERSIEDIVDSACLRRNRVVQSVRAARGRRAVQAERRCCADANYVLPSASPPSPPTTTRRLLRLVY